MQLKTKIKLSGAVVGLGLIAVCLALVFKEKIVDTLQLGVQIDEINIPRSVVLFEKKEVGKPFEVKGTVGMRAQGIEAAMVARNADYAPIQWESIELKKRTPMHFNGSSPFRMNSSYCI